MELFKKFKKFKKIKKEKPFNQLKTFTLIENLKKHMNHGLLPISCLGTLIAMIIFPPKDFDPRILLIFFIFSGLIYGFLFILFSSISFLFNKKIKMKLKKEIIEMNQKNNFKDYVFFDPDETIKKLSFFNYQHLEYIYSYYNLSNVSDADFFIKELKGLEDKEFVENFNNILSLIEQAKLLKDEQVKLFKFLFKKYKFLLEKEIINEKTFIQFNNQSISKIFSDPDLIVEYQNYLEKYLNYYKTLNNEISDNKNTTNKNHSFVF